MKPWCRLDCAWGSSVKRRDEVPSTQARPKLSEPADQMDCGHRLERERIYLLLIDDARRGLADIAAGRTFEADTALAQRQQRRKNAAKLPNKKRG